VVDPIPQPPSPPPAKPLPLGLTPIDVGPWPEGFTVSREQIYGDDGR
jgi:hypothetical protein